MTTKEEWDEETYLKEELAKLHKARVTIEAFAVEYVLRVQETNGDMALADQKVRTAVANQYWTLIQDARLFISQESNACGVHIDPVDGVTVEPPPWFEAKVRELKRRLSALQEGVS